MKTPWYDRPFVAKLLVAIFIALFCLGIALIVLLASATCHRVVAPIIIGSGDPVAAAVFCRGGSR